MCLQFVLQERLIKFEENLASFQSQWAFDRHKQSRDTIIDDLFENSRRKYYETIPCDAPTTTSIRPPIPNRDNNDFDENVTANQLTNKNKNNHLNYRYQKVYQDGTDKTGYNTNTFFDNNIEEIEHNSTSDTNELNKHLEYKQNQQRLVCNMGSNVSRNTAKGLSNRRTQSSG